MVHTITRVYIFLHSYTGIFKKRKKENSFNDSGKNIILLYQKFIGGITPETRGIIPSIPPLVASSTVLPIAHKLEPSN